MTKPSKKSPEIESFLEKLYGRTSAITNDICLKPPVGCGKPVSGFRDDISQKEYSISGLCQRCQDEIFGEYGRT